MSERIAEIEARLSAAAPGPWRWDEGFGDAGDTGLALTNNVGTEILGAYNWHCCSYRDEPTVDENSAEFVAHSPADVAYLLAELRQRDEALAGVEALHKPVQKWEPYEGAGYTFATREDALMAAGDVDLNSVAIAAGPQPFEVCAECSRVEGEQLAEIGEEWGYRESLWPCPTSAAVAAATGDGE